ncbi:methylated-DNA--[protein]-cysteine S-methyltransferase [Myxococcota bacterium]|nr:methylated-DNA--[protein]-cysteine S-methyltransferase [Myxococcota bacterium]
MDTWPTGQLYHRTVPTTLPAIDVELVASGTGLVRASLVERGASTHREGAIAEPGAEHPILAQAARELTEYFAGARRAFTVPLAAEGTPFQREVWAALVEIPFGETCSYRALAERLGRPAAVRAVGAANRVNPIGIIVPCHRVIGAGGALVGYAGGLETKRRLLEHEARVAGRPGQQSLFA